MIDPNSIPITSEILALITEIDEFKGAWQQIHRLIPDRLNALKKEATIESIGSSTRIEGAKLSDKKVEALLSQIDLQSFESRDEQEVAGYAFVYKNIVDHFKFIPITENHIKELHSCLLEFTEKDERHRGEYKKIPIQIEAFNSEGRSSGILYETTSPMETPVRMHELMTWIQQTLKDKSLHPLLAIGLFIVIFLAIHPFQDGNGRLSRLLTTLLMMKTGYTYFPYASLESIIEC